MSTADEIALRALAGSLNQSKTEDGIPITFIGTDGKASTNWIEAYPCVAVTVSNGATGKSRVVWGCLDTGADYVYIDTRLIKHLALPLIRSIEANGEPSALHSGNLRFPSYETLFTWQIASRPLRGQGMFFDLLIGREILNRGRFEYDVRSGNNCRFILG